MGSYNTDFFIQRVNLLLTYKLIFISVCRYSNLNKKRFFKRLSIVFFLKGNDTKLENLQMYHHPSSKTDTPTHTHTLIQALLCTFCLSVVVYVCIYLLCACMSMFCLPRKSYVMYNNFIVLACNAHLKINLKNNFNVFIYLLHLSEERQGRFPHFLEPLVIEHSTVTTSFPVSEIRPV